MKPLKAKWMQIEQSEIADRSTEPTNLEKHLAQMQDKLGVVDALCLHVQCRRISATVAQFYGALQGMHPRTYLDIQAEITRQNLCLAHRDRMMIFIQILQNAPLKDLSPA